MCVCFRCLGQLLVRVPLHEASHSNIKDDVIKLLDYHLTGKTATQRLGASLIISHWIHYAQVGFICVSLLETWADWEIELMIQ